MKSYEVNFDGLIGPTHNYAGLSFGNLASTFNAKRIANPKAAALQGLQKMYQLMRLGLKQAIIPPQERPDLGLLKQLGFSGSVETVLKQAYEKAPEIFLASVSGSSMWAANSATVSPSCDTKNKKVHFTAANLTTHLQRNIETEFTEILLKKYFSNAQHFEIHDSLFSVPMLADEGSANQLRFSREYGLPGIEVFVYGENKSNLAQTKPTRFPARQTLTASKSIARMHQLDGEKTYFIQQNPKAIDAGVFHNDVISVSNQNVFLYHQDAFLELEKLLDKLDQYFEGNFYPIEISSEMLTIQEVVKSYLFNSQIVTLSPEEMMLIAPLECEGDPRVHAVISHILAEPNPIQSVRFVDCSESMQNGGGPACLRLKVVLTPQELDCVPKSIFLTEHLYSKLIYWVEKHYRSELSEQDLCDPAVLQESLAALDELTQILELGSIYPFQRYKVA